MIFSVPLAIANADCINISFYISLKTNIKFPSESYSEVFSQPFFGTLEIMVCAILFPVIKKFHDALLNT